MPSIAQDQWNKQFDIQKQRMELLLRQYANEGMTYDEALDKIAQTDINLRRQAEWWFGSADQYFGTRSNLGWDDGTSGDLTPQELFAKREQQRIDAGQQQANYNSLYELLNHADIPEKKVTDRQLEDLLFMDRKDAQWVGGALRNPGIETKGLNLPAGVLPEPVSTTRPQIDPATLSQLSFMRQKNPGAHPGQAPTTPRQQASLMEALGISV